MKPSKPRGPDRCSPAWERLTIAQTTATRDAFLSKVQSPEAVGRAHGHRPCRPSLDGNEGGGQFPRADSVPRGTRRRCSQGLWGCRRGLGQAARPERGGWALGPAPALGSRGRARLPRGAARLAASKISHAATSATVLCQGPSPPGCVAHPAAPSAQRPARGTIPASRAQAPLLPKWLASPRRAPAPLRTRGKDTSRAEGGETYRVPASPPPRRGPAATKLRGDGR